MKVRVVTPAPPRSSSGNRVTALRWARVLRGLGHTVAVQQDYRGEACDMLVALHARKSAGAVARFRERNPRGPLVVALTGTDLYSDARNGADVTRSLDLASRVVILQPEALTRLPERVRAQDPRHRPVRGAGARPAPAAAPRVRGVPARAPAPGEGPVPRRHGRAAASRRVARDAGPRRGGRGAGPRPRAPRTRRRPTRATSGSATCRGGRPCGCWPAAASWS